MRGSNKISQSKAKPPEFSGGFFPIPLPQERKMCYNEIYFTFLTKKCNVLMKLGVL